MENFTNWRNLLLMKWAVLLCNFFLLVCQSSSCRKNLISPLDTFISLLSSINPSFWQSVNFQTVFQEAKTFPNPHVLLPTLILVKSVSHNKTSSNSPCSKRMVFFWYLIPQIVFFIKNLLSISFFLLNLH